MPAPRQPVGKQRTILGTVAASPRYVADFLRDVFTAFRILLIPTCLCAFASVVLFLPDQTRDYYRLIVEDLADPLGTGRGAAIADAVLPLVFLLGMAACISFSALALLAEQNLPDLCRTACVRRAIVFSPVVFGTLPLLAAFAGLAASSSAIDLQTERTSIDEIRKFGDETFITQLQTLFTWAARSDHYFCLGLLILGALTLAFFLVGISVFSYRQATGARAWHAARLLLIVSLLFSLVAIVSIAAFPVPIGQALGTITVFAIFVGCLTMNATGLSMWSRRLDFPIIPALLVLAGLLAWTDLNDDHELRRIDKSGQQVSSSSPSVAAPAGNVEDEFEKWYGLRHDKSEYGKKQGYPVYIVAAQGGGIYATAQALQFLTKLHTTCERFAQHLFAISGVSGGSVGAALYAALTEEFKPTKEQCRSIDKIGIGSPRPGPMEQVQEAAFELVRNDYDFLSPLVASALFPDFAQRFFAPPITALSRARALEQSIEAAWAATATKFFNGTGSDALKKGILASWDPGGIKPALFFNTTEVGSGRRRIIAPFGFASDFPTDAQFMPLTEQYDIPISAAAVASARFPWLTPAAWFWGKDEAATPAKSQSARFHIVDGGYFENSGVTTAVEIINRLQRRANNCCKDARFYLIVLTSGIYGNGSAAAFSEAVSPVIAMLNSRTARNYSTVDMATRDLGVVDPGAKDALARINKVQKVDFGDYVIPLPLGWRLSKMSATEIFFLTGRVGHCVPDDNFTQPLKITSRIKGFGAADCVQLLILHQLRGDDLDAALAQAKARHPLVP